MLSWSSVADGGGTGTLSPSSMAIFAAAAIGTRLRVASSAYDMEAEAIDPAADGNADIAVVGEDAFIGSSVLVDGGRWCWYGCWKSCCVAAAASSFEMSNKMNENENDMLMSLAACTST